MSAPSRRQVHHAISEALTAHDRSAITLMGLQAATDAVLVLCAEARPKVLWEGPTGGLPGLPDNNQVSLITFEAPPRTNVVVTEADDR